MNVVLGHDETHAANQKPSRLGASKLRRYHRVIVCRSKEEMGVTGQGEDGRVPDVKA